MAAREERPAPGSRYRTRSAGFALLQSAALSLLRSGRITRPTTTAATTRPPAGVDAVRTLRGDPELDPYATLWLVDRGLEKQEAVRPEMAAHMLVETCAVLAAQDGPRAVVQMLSDLGPADEQAAIVGSLWRVEGPHVATVVQAVADAHPDSRSPGPPARPPSSSAPRVLDRRRFRVPP